MRYGSICIAVTVSSILAASCGDGSGGCPGPRIVRTDAESLGTTATCGPEAIPPEVDITTSGTTVTAVYRELLMICGGTIVADLATSGNRLTLTESVEGGGECGCFSHVEMTVAIDVCEPGDYVLVINEVEHPVTL